MLATKALIDISVTNIQYHGLLVGYKIKIGSVPSSEVTIGFSVVYSPGNKVYH